MQEILKSKEDTSGKEMANVKTGFEHVTITPKLKRCKVSTVRDFPPICERGTTSDVGLHRQIAVDQGKYSLSFSVYLYPMTDSRQKS
ncbi:hypothetical protein J1N35_014848 [Gossypium stocksii]|uniref:Uncharacterized protein n=1 Tax=Gossypium stocksii TaxID=47602 RepID=A0A9D4AAA8_9ROSI|nr:hypothetical protein J1N35_014848 [Gossypium stocksii]